MSLLNSMPRLGLVAIAALLIPIALPQQPQKPPPEPDQAPTIKVEVDVVNILCSVRNRQGGLVGGLAKEEFLLSEDGKPQTLKYFTRETDLPLTLGLLVDVSRSQERLIEIEKQAASQFFSSVLRQKDLAFLISFGSEAELLQDYTSSARLLRDGLEGLKVNAPVGGPMPGPVPTVYQPRGTVLYDAVYLAATDRLKGQVGRKALVLITDGVDQGSRLKLEDALQAAQKADAIIYSIYYVDPGAYYGHGFFGGVSDAALKKMSEETGGRLFRVSKNNPLPAIFDQIQQEMRSQYALGYTPSNPIGDGTFRRLDLKTRQKDLKVQARKGYYASKQAEP
jgi:VWFA-related protein